MVTDKQGTDEFDELLKLYSETTEEQTTTFDILDRAADERTHTRFLRWAFDPEGSHELGTAFLNRCLRAANKDEHEIDELDEGSVSTVIAFDREPNNTELDIRIEAGDRLIIFEVKTQSNLRDSQIERQTAYLQGEVEKGEFDSGDYVLITPARQFSIGSYPHLYWQDIHSELAAVIGHIDSDRAVLRFRDWMRTIDRNLIDPRDFGPKSKLALRYGDRLDELGIPYDEDAYVGDRIQLFKRLREWLKDEYRLDSTKEWDIPSQIRRNSDVFRIKKRQWEEVGIRFEVLAREKRLRHGIDHEAEGGYRSHDSLIEVTLRHKISAKDAESLPENPTAGVRRRDRLHKKLVDDGYWEALTNEGFRRPRKLLSVDQPLSKYHIYSKEVPLFDRDGAVFRDIQRAIEKMMAARSSIDEFVESERTRRD